MINPFERFYDTEIEIYSRSAKTMRSADERNLLTTLVCDLQPYTDNVENGLYGLRQEKSYKLYSDRCDHIKDGNLVLFGGKWYMITSAIAWSFGMTAVIRSMENEG